MARIPEIRETKGRGLVAYFSLRTHRPADEHSSERTEWHRIVVKSDALARLVEQQVEAGDRVYLEGRVAYDSYERDRVTIPTVEIIASELILLSNGGRTV